MYYAACCCGSGSPICGCGDYTYASVSIAHSRRDIGPQLVQQKCDRLCRRGHSLVESATATYYAEAKIYMRCGITNDTDGRYTSEEIQPQYLKFDPASVSVLYSENQISYETEYVPEVLDCCEPPFQSNICGTEGQRSATRRLSVDLLPFDVLNPASPSTFVRPFASTVVRRGDEFLSAPDVVSSQPNLYYRRTNASVTWSLLALRDYYRQTYQGNVDQSLTEVVIPPGGFGSGVTQAVEQWSLIGDECDSHAIGTVVATFGRSGSNSVELPYSNITNINEPTNCNPQQYFAQCCDPLYREYPASTGNDDYTFGTELDGGTFGLEFMDEPPPLAP